MLLLFLLLLQRFFILHYFVFYFIFLILLVLHQRFFVVQDQDARLFKNVLSRKIYIMRISAGFFPHGILRENLLPVRSLARATNKYFTIKIKNYQSQTISLTLPKREKSWSCKIALTVFGTLANARWMHGGFRRNDSSETVLRKPSDTVNLHYSRLRFLRHIEIFVDRANISKSI